MVFDEKKKHTLQVIKWYGRRRCCKAIRVEIDGGFYNMALHPMYVEILNPQTVRVWGSHINFTVRRAKENNRIFQKKRQADSIQYKRNQVYNK